ncbi:MAG: hypothetical protein ACKOA5_11020, partial [Actinomycetota bacterium]
MASVVVAHPRPGLDATLEALAAQDYPHLNHLFFVVGATGGSAIDPRVEAIAAAITAALPRAIV